jgi:hypothetical protein
MKRTGNLYFDLFWDAYPKRVKKILALKEWHRLKDFTISDILAGIERWKLTDQWQDMQFVPDPERFLKYRRWEDEVPKNAGTKSEQRVNRAMESAVRIAKEYGIGTDHRQVGNAPERTLPGGPHGRGTKNLH